MSEDIDDIVDNLDLKPEHLSIHAINPFVEHNSASRSQMFGSHLSQTLVTEGMDTKNILTGVEQELGKYTKQIITESDMEILHIIPRYRSIENPNYHVETTIVYKNLETQEIDYFNIRPYETLHQTHGFKMKPTKQAKEIRIGNRIPKDTILYDSVAKTDDGDYNFGTNMNVCFMSHPSVAEDGVMISKSSLEKLTFHVWEKRVINIGTGGFLINLYGDDDHYKPFPDIGEKVHDNGMLACVRKHNTNLSPVLLTKKALQTVDYITDTPVYSRDNTGIVTDIKVVRNIAMPNNLYTGMNEPLLKYNSLLVTYYKELLDVEESCSKRYKNVLYSHKLQNLLMEARAMVVGDHTPTGNRGAPKLRYTYKANDIDNYRIEFTIRTTITPTKGNKITDMHG